MSDEKIYGTLYQSDLLGWVLIALGTALLGLEWVDQYAWLGTCGLSSWLIVSGKPPTSVAVSKEKSEVK